MTTRQYKDLKGLKKQNLRDNMSTTELILNMLAETATKDITNTSNPQGLQENKKVAKRGGNVAKVARETLEKETGEPVITSKNAIDFGKLIGDVVKDIPNTKDDDKEEQRRLQCGVYLAKKFPTYKAISTQNKINFITGLQGLSDCLVYGLYVVMNSTLYDNYYRILNGSTQVNATEINSMPIPPLTCIENMGKELIKLKDMSEENCDKILRKFMYV